MPNNLIEILVKNKIERELGDIENELDSVLDRYQKQQEQTRDRELREQDDYVALENEFKTLFVTIVQPSMTKNGRISRVKRRRIQRFVC